MEQMILRAIAVALALLLAPPVAAEEPVTIRSYKAALDLPPAAAADSLNRDLGGLMEFREEGGALFFDYAGLDTPEPLRRFLALSFPDLPPEAIARGVPVNLSLAFLPDGDGSEIRLMISGPEFGGAGATLSGLPEGATILMSSVAGDCAGQAVLSHQGLPPDIAPAYVTRLAGEGYQITDASDDDTSFFVGYRPGCALFLYFQPDPAGQDRSTVVMNFQEE